MKSEPSDKLYIIVTLSKGAKGSFTHGCKCIGEDILELLAFFEAHLELSCFSQKGLI